MRENYALHKLHSLTGIVPVGFYMVQHLTLNSFSLAGADKFNAVIAFFDSMPTHVLLALEIVAIWIPLAFHAVYGVFIAARADENYTEKAYRYRENRYFLLQRVSGIFAFLFLIYHVFTTTYVAKTGMAGVEAIKYAAWHDKLMANGTYWVLALYMLGTVACAYHLSYGIWNFCIRWGITVSERAQNATAKFAAVCFILLSLLSLSALFGFLNPVLEHKSEPIQATLTVGAHSTASSLLTDLK
ncbi:MAG TPA: hypothetical protein VNI20_14175 [Fimbriimonadaceae bacterium]|nr:hypothetical protein [Fimbriimonadaceae bacterium]